MRNVKHSKCTAVVEKTGRREARRMKEQHGPAKKKKTELKTVSKVRTIHNSLRDSCRAMPCYALLCHAMPYA